MPTVFITGASRGIGRAAAIAFAKDGYCVGINYNRSAEQAEALLSDIRGFGGYASLFQGDVSDYSACEKMLGDFTSVFGPVDVLVNNAGVSCDMLFTDTSPEDWHRVFAVNADGAFNCCRAVANSMISRKKGSIINVSSMWGVIGASCEVAYSASKAAVIGLTKALAKELGPSNIRVNCIAPGVIDTDMLSHLSPNDIAALEDETPLCRIGSPEEAAKVMLFLASGEASFITGAVINVNGGMVI